MSDYTTLAIEDRDGIAVLSRPEAMNAFTPTMADELEHYFRAVNDAVQASSSSPAPGARSAPGWT